MPSGYAVAGLVERIIVLGYLIWTVFTHTPPQIPHQEHTFSPGPGYDRPRDDWTNGDEDSQQRRRRRRAPECAICKESLARQEIRNLPCTHIFHDNCITEWFQHSRTCPTCRRPA